MTEAGQGNWVRIGKNQYAMTVYRTLVDANGNTFGTDGKPFGTPKFWGVATAVTEAEISGTLNAEYYDATGSCFFGIYNGISTGKRIAVE